MAERENKRSKLARWYFPKPDVEWKGTSRQLNDYLDTIHEPDIMSMVRDYQNSINRERRYRDEIEERFDRRVRGFITHGCERFSNMDEGTHFSRWAGATTAWHLYIPSLYPQNDRSRLQLASRRAVLIGAEASAQIDGRMISPDVIGTIWKTMVTPQERRSATSLSVHELLTEFVNNPQYSEVVLADFSDESAK